MHLETVCANIENFISSVHDTIAKVYAINSEKRKSLLKVSHIWKIKSHFIVCNRWRTVVAIIGIRMDKMYNYKIKRLSMEFESKVKLLCFCGCICWTWTPSFWFECLIPVIKSMRATLFPFIKAVFSPDSFQELVLYGNVHAFD